MAAFVVTTAWVLAACETQGVEATQSLGEAHVPQKAEAKTKPAVPQTYGQVRQPNGRVIPLAKIAANPTRYEGRQVRTEGEIQRVCQKKGCWLELTDATAPVPSFRWPATHSRCRWTALGTKRWSRALSIAASAVTPSASISRMTARATGFPLCPSRPTR